LLQYFNSFLSNKFLSFSTFVYVAYLMSLSKTITVPVEYSYSGRIIFSARMYFGRKLLVNTASGLWAVMGEVK